MLAQGARGANERIGVGFIGTGGRAGSHMDIVNELKQQGIAEPVAVCDVYRPRLEAASKKTGGTKMYVEHEALLADPERRRGLHRHARPAARPAGDRRAERRQGRLLRKAADALGAVRTGQEGGGGRQARTGGWSKSARSTWPTTTIPRSFE